MSEHSKTWFRLRWRSLFLLTILGVVGWSAYSYWSEYSERAARIAREMMAPSVGAKCTIIYRTDELGLESNRLAPVQIDSTTNHVQGTFVQLNDDWIVLAEADGRQLWIPRGHVLLLRVEP